MREDREKRSRDDVRTLGLHMVQNLSERVTLTCEAYLRNPADERMLAREEKEKPCGDGPE